MNIATAVRYFEYGYRIRRSVWEPDEYLTECAGMLDKMEAHTYHEHDSNTGKSKECRTLSSTNDALMVEDLLAEDWEVVLTGIRKPFNKYGLLEYEDDIDHDNWKDESTWFD
jgi:hypothetical protein